MAWTWEFMLQVFCSLGGAATNIGRESGMGSRGLVPADPTKPVRLHAPENLIFPITDVEFVGGQLKLEEAATCGKAERAFFENYHETFAWGGSGRHEAAAFIRELDQLPSDVRALLSTEFGMNRLLEGGNERIEQWFLESRRIDRRDGGVLVPFLEMVTHDPAAAPFNDSDGVSVAGRFSAEVLALWSRGGPFGVFLKLGMASPESMAFSLPLTCKTANGLIVIGQNINFNSSLDSLAVPDFEWDGDTLRLSCMMIGNSRAHRLSRAIFYRIMRDAGQSDPDQVFDNILLRNRLTFFKLLEVLEPYEGGMIGKLRKVARYQLETMSYCIGTRAL